MKSIVTFVDNRNHSLRASAVTDLSRKNLLQLAKNKLKLPRARLLFEEGGGFYENAVLERMTLYVSCGEPYQGPPNKPAGSFKIVSVKSEIDPSARDELIKVATLPGVIYAVGMPDLHSGPTGCAVLTQDCVYPHLAGNDIGCGIALFRAGKSKKFNLDKMTKFVGSIPGLTTEEIKQALHRAGLAESDDDHLLGSVGNGNHFSEVMQVYRVFDENRFADLGIEHDDALLCVHSGSRNLGNRIFDKYGPKCIPQSEAQSYLARHDHAVRWARLNRETIASRLLKERSPDKVLDITHNGIFPVGDDRWVHRKGAAPTDMGPVVIPGSRGTYSYIVCPKDIDMSENNYSVAHGAGRQLTRSKAHAKAVKRHGPDMQNLKTTDLGSRVICSDLRVLGEEIPEAYKDIEAVIDDLRPYVDVIARLKPLLTIKDF